MQLIGHLFQVALNRRGSCHHRGRNQWDTGSAAIEAFRGCGGCVHPLPTRRVSEVQRRQMTTPTESNVHALAVNGTFDDCQSRLKDMFNDFEFRDSVKLAGVIQSTGRVFWRRLSITSHPRFSWARHIARSALPCQQQFGISLRLYCQTHGLPIDRLVVATNQNDILHRCLSTGEYRMGDVIPSISPSMDIQISSNLNARCLMPMNGMGPRLPT